MVSDKKKFCLKLKTIIEKYVNRIFVHLNEFIVHILVQYIYIKYESFYMYLYFICTYFETTYRF